MVFFTFKKWGFFSLAFQEFRYPPPPPPPPPPFSFFFFNLTNNLIINLFRYRWFFSPIKTVFFPSFFPFVPPLPPPPLSTIVIFSIYFAYNISNIDVFLFRCIKKIKEINGFLKSEFNHCTYNTVLYVHLIFLILLYWSSSA